MPFVDPKRVEAGRLARARALDPERAEIIEALSFLVEAYTTDLLSVLNAIESNSPALREQTAVVVDPAGKRGRVIIGPIR